jgi:hypothetical protein
MGGGVNNISSRNHKAGKEAETLLWRALCDDMDDAKEYIASDCVMMNPLLSDETIDEVHKFLDKAEPLQAYKMGKDLKVVEIDMMAVQVLYHGDFTTADGREVSAACASTWRQTAGGDWRLCAMMVSPEA